MLLGTWARPAHRSTFAVHELERERERESQKRTQGRHHGGRRRIGVTGAPSHQGDWQWQAKQQACRPIDPARRMPESCSAAAPLGRPTSPRSQRALGVWACVQRAAQGRKDDTPNNFVAAFFTHSSPVPTSTSCGGLRDLARHDGELHPPA
jgi:hypothetical protein